MIYYKAGCNFDPGLVDGISELNKTSRHTQVNELYGSDRRHAFLTARPAFRLPDVSEAYIGDFIRKCTNAGIEFNYTLNSIYPGSKRQLASKRSEIIDFVKFLEGAGVKVITVTSPILADFVRDASRTIELEISTIAHIDTITQIKAWRDRFDISRVCGNLLRNRSIKFLRKAAAYCRQNGIILSLMVNEFCGVGGRTGSKSYGTHCIYRDSCYLCHAENESREDDELLNFYPMGYCMSSRSDPASWLKMLFIRPEDVQLYYQRVGINHFKVTGRTGTTEYLLKMAEAYLRNSWSGNLLALWKPLETILTGENELEFEHPCFIDNRKLTGFLNYWFDNEDHDCANEVCGETCCYCDEFYDRVLRA